jgi:hypothetical protein
VYIGVCRRAATVQGVSVMASSEGPCLARRTDVVERSMNVKERFNALKVGAGTGAGARL